MKTFLIAGSVVFVLWAVPALAQHPTVPPSGTVNLISPGEVAATPDMWFYEQYRQEHQDPKAAVRRKAEFRTAQRQARIAAMKWFGFSAARPQASGDPWNSDYSPRWTSNNHFYPFRWSGCGGPWIIVHRTGSVTHSH